MLVAFLIDLINAFIKGLLASSSKSFVSTICILSYALRTIEMSVAYAIWGALGILLISVIGIIFLHESISTLKVISILLIVLGTIGLRLAS